MILLLLKVCTIQFRLHKRAISHQFSINIAFNKILV